MSSFVRQSSLQSFVAVLVLFGFIATAEGQMEKRNCELYLTKEFLQAKPAVGSVAPDLALTTLDGTEVRLSDYLDKTIVIVKGGYT